MKWDASTSHGASRPRYDTRHSWRVPSHFHGSIPPTGLPPSPQASTWVQIIVISRSQQYADSLDSCTARVHKQNAARHSSGGTGSRGICVRTSWMSPPIGELSKLQVVTWGQRLVMKCSGMSNKHGAVVRINRRHLRLLSVHTWPCLCLGIPRSNVSAFAFCDYCQPIMKITVNIVIRLRAMVL